MPLGDAILGGLVSDNDTMGTVMLSVALTGGAIGAVVGGCVGGLPGALAGAIVGALGPLAVAAAVGMVVVVAVTAYKLAEIAVEEVQSAYSDHKRSQKLAEKEKELATQRIKLEQDKETVKATTKEAEDKHRQAEEMKREAQEMKRKAEARKVIIDQKLIELAAEKIITVKEYIDILKEQKMPPEKIKERVKMRRSTTKSFANVFFEDDVRDAKTDALLEDCVRAPDGYYYNRSTLVDIYEQARKEGKAAFCFKDSTKALPNPATLPTDEGFRATIQALRQKGLAEGLSLSSPNPATPLNKTPVVETPTLIEKLSMSSQENTTQEKTFLRAPAGYCAFFIPEQLLDLTAEPTDAAIMVERQALTIGD